MDEGAVQEAQAEAAGQLRQQHRDGPEEDGRREVEAREARGGQEAQEVRMGAVAGHPWGQGSLRHGQWGEQR